MARRVSSADRLENALEAMMADPKAPLSAVDPALRQLLEIASELSCRPTQEFKDRLKADLQRGEEISYRVEPYLRVRGARPLLDFMRRAFAAEEVSCDTLPDGTVLHAEVRIGDSVVGAGDAKSDDTEPMPTAIHLYVPDADAVYARALKAGATSMQEPMDQPYGDREGGVRDPFGNHWYIGTHQAGRGGRAAPHIPDGLRTMNSYLHPRGASQLIDFLQRAFGAEVAFVARAPDQTVAHAKIRIGESVVEMGEAHAPYEPMPTVYHLYVNDTDAAYRRAMAAGAVSLGEPADRPWGFRNAGVEDPGGNQWWLNAPIQKSDDRQAAENEPDAAESGVGVTPFLFVREVRRTADFLAAAFGAEVVAFDRGGDPPHDHADLRLGASTLMMGEAVGDIATTASAFYLQVPDVDAAYARALGAGAASLQPPRDMPWGDRMAHVADPFGNTWFIAAKRTG